MSYIDQILQELLGNGPMSPLQQSALQTSQQVGQPVLGNQAAPAFQQQMQHMQQNPQLQPQNTGYLPPGADSGLMAAKQAYDDTQKINFQGDYSGFEALADAIRAPNARDRLDDARVAEEANQRKIAFNMLRQLDPNASDEEIQVRAKAVANDFVTLDQFIPKAQDVGQLEEEFQTLIKYYGEEKAKQMIDNKYQPKGEGGSGLLPFAKMPSEQKTKLGLISSANNLLNESVPQMFNEKGEYLNVSGMMPKSDVGIALDDLRESLTQTLRATSGAAIPETEIEREVNSMMPTWHDTDKQARAKIERIRSKLDRLHTAMTEGFEGVPTNLQLQNRSTATSEDDDGWSIVR